MGITKVKGEAPKAQADRAKNTPPPTCKYID